MKIFNKNGFTIIELVIATTIILSLLGSMYGILHGSVTLWQRASEKIDLQQNARIALNMIEMDIKRADTVHISSSDSRVLLNKGNEIIGYHLSGSQILRTVFGQGNNPVAYSVSKL